MVAAVGVDGEGAEDFAGGGVHDPCVVAVDEHDDAGSVEGSAESDVVQLAVDSQADSSGLDAVVADAELVVGVRLEKRVLKPKPLSVKVENGMPCSAMVVPKAVTTMGPVTRGWAVTDRA